MSQGIRRLRVEHHRDPRGISEPAPRLSWEYHGLSEPPAVVEVQARSLWTGAVETEIIGGHASVLAPWPFTPLSSREARELRIRVPDGTWTDPLVVEAGLLDAADWSPARMISPRHDKGAGGPAVLLRRRFSIPGGVRQARLYTTGWGMQVNTLGGRRVGDERLAPGWTSYHHRLRYRVHDVTELLEPGSNEWIIELADGWFRGRLGWQGGVTEIWGSRLGAFAQLVIDHADGSTERIGTDETWDASESPVRSSSIYDGETRDERVVARFDGAVDAIAFDPRVLVGADGPPVRETQRIRPVGITRIGPRVVRYDFGQNLVGVVRLVAEGDRGAMLDVRYAEVLEADELATRPLRLARSTDRLVLDGRATTWQPEFTFHGFRYAEITLSDPGVVVADVEAVVIHSDMERTGWFRSSDAELDRLVENARWSMRGNFIDVPIDCPQRDERLGWTGDVTVFAPAATGLYDCFGVLSSWLEDLSREQLSDPSGIPPLVVPDILDRRPAYAIWGDAVVVVPWVLYQRYGDAAVLERAWTGIERWLRAVRDRTGNRLIWDHEFQLGDWLDPAADPDSPAAGRTDPALVATAWFARSAQLAARIADVLGKDPRPWRRLSDDVGSAFRREFMTSAGRLASDSQTAYALAIVFGLYRGEAAKARGARRLAQLVEAARFRIGTGFAGTPFVADALVLGGYAPHAHRLLAETGLPSFRYPVAMGATTFWERWDAMLPDGSVNPGEMTSFNHYALGAIVDWIQRRIAGIAPAGPGYRRIRIAPLPGDLAHAEGRLRTPYGDVETAWRVADGRFELRVAIPVGASAVVELPDGTTREAGAGTGRFSCAYRWRGITSAAPSENGGGSPSRKTAG